MRLIKELLKYPSARVPSNFYMCTTNTVVKANGELVMGAGNALAFATAYPYAPKYFASRTDLPVSFYIRPNKPLIGVFRTKRNWRNPSTLALVQESITSLKEEAIALPECTFHLPFPAIGRGGLPRTEVEPLLEELPDNVLIYIKEY